MTSEPVRHFTEPLALKKGRSTARTHWFADGFVRRVGSVFSQFVLAVGFTWGIGIGIGIATADDTVFIGKNPSECDVALALGVNKPGCPPLAQLGLPSGKATTRGLAIGTIDQMPEPPSAHLPPAHPASPAAAPVRPTIAAPVAHPAISAPVVQAPPTAVVNHRPPLRHEFKASFQIAFEFGSARLTDDARHILNLVGAALSAPDAAGSRFRIVGHTDRIGSDATNLRLSEERARAVQDYLIAHFAIASARLQAVGKGAQELLNRDHPNAAENRRVEITNLGEP